MDLGTLINNMRLDGSIALVANNPAAQFGTPTRRYIGVELLPERTVPENSYREENIRYRTIIANDGTRYSPVQKKSGELTGAFDVTLADSDIGREFSGRDYDNFLRILAAQSMDAAVQILQWSDTVLLRGLLELVEKQRWDAILNAQVVRSGSNGYTETISYTNPAGHRVNAAGTWSDNNYDPYADITAMVNLLSGKGYTVSRIITRRPVISILSQNAFMRQRMGITTLSPGVLAGVRPGFLDLASINNILQRDGLPPIEEYNLQYRTQTGSAYFLTGNAMVFVCTTGRDETLDLGDSVKQVTDTLGYTAVGRPVGESAPGRVIKLFPYEDKPPRIEGQAWQTTLPVITEAEALGVIKSIS